MNRIKLAIVVFAPGCKHYTVLERLDLPTEVRQKIYRGNAERVYGLAKERK